MEKNQRYIKVKCRNMDLLEFSTLWDGKDEKSALNAILREVKKKNLVDFSRNTLQINKIRPLHYEITIPEIIGKSIKFVENFICKNEEDTGETPPKLHASFDNMPSFENENRIAENRILTKAKQYLNIPEDSKLLHFPKIAISAGSGGVMAELFTLFVCMELSDEVPIFHLLHSFHGTSGGSFLLPLIFKHNGNIKEINKAVVNFVLNKDTLKVYSNYFSKLAEGNIENHNVVYKKILLEQIADGKIFDWEEIISRVKNNDLPIPVYNMTRIPEKHEGIAKELVQGTPFYMFFPELKSKVPTNDLKKDPIDYSVMSGNAMSTPVEYVNKIINMKIVPHMEGNDSLFEPVKIDNFFNGDENLQNKVKSQLDEGRNLPKEKFLKITDGAYKACNDITGLLQRGIEIIIMIDIHNDVRIIDYKKELKEADRTKLGFKTFPPKSFFKGLGNIFENDHEDSADILHINPYINKENNKELLCYVDNALKFGFDKSEIQFAKNAAKMQAKPLKTKLKKMIRKRLRR